MTTGIEWTDKTWNAATGCTKVSRGCDECYAEEIAEGMRARGVPKYRDGFRYREHANTESPARGRRKMIFVNSMSDFFHEQATEPFQFAMLDSMISTPNHIYQILTKRPNSMVRVVRAYCAKAGIDVLPRHIWCGVSVENDRYLHRIDRLRDAQATTRFISFEPLLGHIRKADLASMDWAIIGGESGQRHRPMKTEWVRDLISICRKQSVPVFFKQWGGLKHYSGGRTFGGRTYDEYPAYLASKTGTDGQMTFDSLLAGGTA